MVTTLRLSSGQRLAVGRKIAEGGEGGIYELPGVEDRLAKLYHRPVNSSLQGKLNTMLRLRTPELESVAAWPIDLVCNKDNRCTGFVMPRVEGPGVVDKLSHPAEQRVAFPAVDYRFLIHVARNIMFASATVHAAGCVIGDVNESNVFIRRDGTVRFIDVDSFQIESGGRVYPCNVGTPLFTPPELQGLPLSGVERRPTHDLFGLSVLVFQLLMQGCHPFAGVPGDGRGRTIEESIKAGLYAYSPSCADRMKPPPGRLDVRSLGEMAGLFERSFRLTDRPTAGEWIQTLGEVLRGLRRCATNPRHYHLRETKLCPLCSLPRDPYPHCVIGGAQHDSVDAMSVGALIKQATSLVSWKPLEERCDLAMSHLESRPIPELPPSFSPRSQSAKGLTAMGIGGASCVIGCLLCFGSEFLCVLGISIILISVVLVIGGHDCSSREIASRREAALRAYEPVRRRAIQAIDRFATGEDLAISVDRISSRVLRQLASQISSECSWLKNSESGFKAELRNADASYRANRVREYLSQYVIARESIPEIGPSRKAMLASFGIETAADIKSQEILRIPGFGPHLSKRLVSWRGQCERKYPLPKTLRAPPDWIARIEAEHRGRVSARVAQLRRVLAEYKEKHAICDRQLEDAVRDLRASYSECQAALTLVWSA